MGYAVWTRSIHMHSIYSQVIQTQQAYMTKTNRHITVEGTGMVYEIAEVVHKISR